MGTIRLDFDTQQIEELYRRLNGTLRGLPQVLSASLNDATADAVPKISSAIRSRVNVKQRDLDPKITRTIAQPSLQPTAQIALSNKRFPLKYFDARQEKGGVRYKIAADGFIPRAFIGRSGDVLRRNGMRIIKLYGPSPWRMLVKSGLAGPSVERIAAATAKNVTDRIQKFFR